MPAVQWTSTKTGVATGGNIRIGGGDDQLRTLAKFYPTDRESLEQTVKGATDIAAPLIRLQY
jgi:hypothetical protein